MDDSCLERWPELVASSCSRTSIRIEIGYTNSQGVPYRTPLWQIVLHVVNHSTHHRGQVVDHDAAGRA